MSQATIIAAMDKCFTASQNLSHTMRTVHPISPDTEKLKARVWSEVDDANKAQAEAYQKAKDLRKTATTKPPAPAANVPAPLSKPHPSGKHATLTAASDVTIEKPRFIDQPIMPLGVITLFAGRAGVSKSTLSIDRAAKATRGLLEGDCKGHPVNVAFSGIEDSLSMQKARLMAADADMSRVQFLTMQNTVNGTDITTGLSLPDDLPEIRKLLIDADIRLWILDPITSCISGNTDKRDDVRAALDPLAALAEDLDIAIVGILHFNKGAGYASDKVSGSHAFRDICRSLLLVAKDDEDGSIIATLDKNNYTLAQGASYSYGLTSVDITDDLGQSMSVPKVTGFMPSERTVSEVINRNIGQGEQSGNGRAESGAVLSWLTDYLGDEKVPFSQIKKDASSLEGYTPKQLQNARDNSNGVIATERDPGYKGRGKQYLWLVQSNTNEHE
ncbi:AAA family ATPase [Bifidobacterium tibiigranuli]|jgi:hypothetical protein|uniref:AAA family ATPase n=1 Tax=Bifidobacterium tibiigranuli TaxID=2172043 RepID=UPI0026F1A469|nr:AAA family ATPase [Bifidobacterium tibiigranuli]MCI2185205.1 AAA family ATPase [Bifidobacterium tibiigranuli]MCI2203230.1 AAA family ATPase [Bifidobacterium tibiigranuli]